MKAILKRYSSQILITLLCTKTVLPFPMQSTSTKTPTTTKTKSNPSQGIKSEFPIAATICSGILLFTGAVFFTYLAHKCMEFIGDLNYMKKVRKCLMKDGLSEDNNRFYWFSVLLRILFGHLFCRCCCCKVSYGSKIKVKQRYEIKDWNSFIDKETIPITQEDLHDMRQKYINHHYHHKHYCFKNAGERCNNSQCFHYETIMWKGLLHQPVLYLLIVNFDDAKEICKDITEAGELIGDKKKLNWFYNNDSPVVFPFKVIFKQNLRGSTEFQLTEDSLSNKVNNICLVIEDFPGEYISNFQDEEKLVLENILRLHHEYRFQLMYSVR